MQNNYQLTNEAISINAFDNIESIESIYPAESIEIIDDVSMNIIGVDHCALEPGTVAANDEQTSGNIYSLDNARLTKQSKSHERRACKSRLTDRRSGTRVTANGDIQQDRRAINKITNVDAIRLARLATQSVANNHK